MANRTPTTNGVEARYHQHPGQSQGHLHRRGNEPHEHDANGRPLFHEDLQPRDPATGKFLAKREPTPTEVAEADTIILERPDLISADTLLRDFEQALDALGDPADRITTAYDNAAFLIDLASQQLDNEWAQYRDAATRLQAEVVDRSRYMVLAAAAQAQGHHPLTAYCFVADRLDPAGAAS